MAVTITIFSLADYTPVKYDNYQVIFLKTFFM